ncbi:hypothetical protein Tco_1374768 [Tanacetum coccineum]
MFSNSRMKVYYEIIAEFQDGDHVQKTVSENVSPASRTSSSTHLDNISRTVNALPTSTEGVTSRKRSTSKRTRTPLQLSPPSKQAVNVGGSVSAISNLTPRTKGKPRISDDITRTAPCQGITPVGSLKFKSTIVNDIGKGTTSVENHAISIGQSSLVNNNMQKLKGKLIMRQSARRINFTEDVPAVGKNAKQKKYYIDHGDPTFECPTYGALLWYTESIRGATNTSSDSYSLCCGRGKVRLTNEVREPPPLLKALITKTHPKSASFIDNIMRYNSMFSFTSMGGKQDNSVNVGRGPYCYRLHGENYHLAGSLLPQVGKPAKFAQLYIFDTDNEIENRIKALSNGESSSSKNNDLDYQLTKDIRDMLDSINPLVKDFRMAGERIRASDDKKIKLRLIGTRTRDGRDYNLPTASEVAALIVGDFDSTTSKRDIILHCQDGDFKRISELHP